VLLWNLNCYLAKFKDDPLLPPLYDIHRYTILSEDSCLEFMAPTKTRIQEKSSMCKDRLLIRFEKSDPFFKQFDIQGDFTSWLIRQIGYEHDDENSRFSIDWGDTFSQCVLIAVFIRKSFSLCMHRSQN